MNPSFNQHENIKNTNLAQPRNKKAIPISLITGTDSIFIKGKINNVATSYFESSQKIQNLYKEKNSYIKKDTLKKIQNQKLIILNIQQVLIIILLTFQLEILFMIIKKI